MTLLRGGGTGNSTYKAFPGPTFGALFRPAPRRLSVTAAREVTQPLQRLMGTRKGLTLLFPLLV